jgi:hypothetical protein
MALSHDQEAELVRLRAELASAHAALDKARKVRLTNVRVSEKGAVSVYGLARYPITLYANQWEILLSQAEQILDYIEANRARLARKE